jgi:hypothetical protein
MSERFARLPASLAAATKLSGADFRVLLAIALHADVNGHAFPGMSTIADVAKVGRGDVPRHIRRLGDAKVLECISGGGRSRNSYRVLGVSKSADSETADSEIADPASANPLTQRQQSCGPSVSNPADAASANSPSLIDNRPSKQTIEQSGSAGTPPAAKADRKKPLTEVPENWQPSDADRSYAEQAGWSPRRITDEVPRFVDHHRKKDDRFADWHAAWRTWVRNGIKFDQERRQSPAPYANGHDASGESYAERQLRKNRAEAGSAP